MFTVQQTVANAGTAPVQVATYALVNRKGVSVDPESWTIHIGPMAVHGGSVDYDINFKDIDAAPERFDTTGGWLGFSDKYLLTALIPDQGQSFEGPLRAGANQAYQADSERKSGVEGKSGVRSVDL